MYRRSPSNVGIWAVPFSLDTLTTTGEPFVVAPGQYLPSVARDGTLVYAPGGSGLAQPARLTWVDRSGSVAGSIGVLEPGLQFPVPSHDGSRVAVATTDGVIWVYDVVNGTRARLMVEPGLNLEPAWLPAGDRLVYVARSSFDAGLPHLVIRGLDGAVTSSKLAEGQNPTCRLTVAIWSTSPMEAEDASTSCAWICSSPGRRSQSSTIRTPRSVTHRCRPTVSGSRSPPTLQDGTRCTSRAFLTRDGRWQLSTGGGGHPRWRGDGRELFYLAGDTLMAVGITSEPIFSAGAPAVLFSANRPSAGIDVARDGKRFVTIRSEEDGTTQTVTVVQHWFAEFRQRGR